MGIPIYQSPPSKEPGDKTSAANQRCNNLPPTTWASAAAASAPSPTAADEASTTRRGSSMLTLDEFLRETSQSDSERNLHTLLLMHRPPPPPQERRRFEHSSPGQDSFDTLVSQIRRIGALQDVMLNSVDGLEEPEESANGGRRDRNRSAVDALRVREARLRAMQTRIDLLASEFALLRNTRRELRRVEAMEIQDARRGVVAGAPGRPETDEEAANLLPPERRTVRRAFLQPPEGGASTSASTSASTPAPATGEEGATPTPVSIDRRSPAMTIGERDLMLRNAVMQMQIDRLAGLEL